MKDTEIKIVGEARYVDAESCAGVAKVGIMDAQFFILLFDVSDRVKAILKKPFAEHDPMEKYLVIEHLRELADPPVGEPLVAQICSAEHEDPEGWDYRYGYLEDMNPPKRYVVLEPPVDAVCEPYEYVTKILTAAREKGSKLSLEFVWIDDDNGVDPEEEDDEHD